MSSIVMVDQAKASNARTKARKRESRYKGPFEKKGKKAAVVVLLVVAIAFYFHFVGVGQ